MKRMKSEICTSMGIVVAAVMIIFGTAAIVSADGLVPNTFQQGTTISSQQVNTNFSALANALPGVKSAHGAPPGFNFTTTWQTVTQTTVTPPADGIFLIFANTQVAFNLQPNGNSMVSFCVSTSSSSNDCRGIFGASFVAPCTTCGPALSVPVNATATVSVSKGVPVTFFLLAKKGSDNTDTITLASDDMFAVFLPNQW
jgi:hypothetical protein